MSIAREELRRLPPLSDFPFSDFGADDVKLSSRGRSRATNFAGLVLGFGLGQGSLFAVQTWLLVDGELRFMGQFNFIFTMIIMSYQAIDMGGLVILPRHLADARHPKDEFARKYWSLSAVRAAIAVVLTIAAIGWVFTQPESFEANYAAAATVGFIILSVNPSGVLDGYHKSGWTGATWALPFVSSALALPFCPNLPLVTAGWILGAALSSGGVLAVACQFLILQRQGIALRWHRPTRGSVYESGREALFYMVGWLPGQLYFRGQAAICMVMFGPGPTAMFIYAKQLIMAATRFLYFARRVEYPYLVKQLADRNRLIWKIISIQKISIAMGAVGAIAFGVFGLVLYALFESNLGEAGIVIAIFAPIVFTASANSTFMQACYAVDMTATNAWVSVVITLIGLTLQLAFATHLGIAGIAVSEGIAHALGVLLVVLSLQDRIRFGAARRGGAAAPASGQHHND